MLLTLFLSVLIVFIDKGIFKPHKSSIQEREFYGKSCDIIDHKHF